MRKRLIPACILIAYTAILVRVVVFKNLHIHIGHLRFSVATDGTGSPNFVPFKNILMYLHGGHAAFINLVGNIVLFVPIGFLAPFVFPKITWQRSIMLAVGTGLTMELTEAIFRVGIFDVDDIMLNGLGVMIGYWMYVGRVRRRRRLKLS